MKEIGLAQRKEVKRKGIEQKDGRKSNSLTIYCKFKEEKTMKKLFHFLKEEEGVTAIEYGLIAALIAVAIIVVVGEVGTKLNTTFTSVRDALP